MTLKHSFVSLLAFIAVGASAAENAKTAAPSEESSGGILKDFDSLGGNRVLYEKAQALSSDQKISIVQNRIVDRNLRLEFAPEVGMVLGGDSYLKTQSYGANLHFHINPHWSLGLKSFTHRNQLSAEGENLIENSNAAGRTLVPDIDYPKEENLLLVNWYPIYGKLNVLDYGVVHFDVYVLAGAGQMTLSSGKTGTQTAGGGIGFWISQHLTARAEMRYQSYKVHRLSGEDNLNITTGGLQLGYLF